MGSLNVDFYNTEKKESLVQVRTSWSPCNNTDGPYPLHSSLLGWPRLCLTSDLYTVLFFHLSNLLLPPLSISIGVDF